ncbi:hypothetical protein HPE56_15630 [Maribacter sp. ANRC-HE7]|uniref:Uncharacterized protein n=1 Tax=Maribacter aquimaris TaxID=2737171 RepID=A0ABR7V3K7_9FLAO|nr:hypothetical protein [Maribacter aquimaris]MBD0779231.1 hypothetical protein [Maribacter aquimaris]
MKPIKINILILLFALIQMPGHAQSEKDMINTSIIIPLKIGKNPSTHFESLDIEPANLIIQSKPIKEHSPHIQLALNIVGKNKEYTTYLWYYDEAMDNQRTNYPKAFDNYAFSLNINKEEVDLVVEKLDFKKAFFIDIGQTAVIGDITILFEQCIGEWSEDPDGNQVAAFNTYYVSLMEKNEQKTISFTSLNKSVRNELSIEWKNYTFLVLDDSEKELKLMVCRKD